MGQTGLHPRGELQSGSPQKLPGAWGPCLVHSRARDLIRARAEPGVRGLPGPQAELPLALGQLDCAPGTRGKGPPPEAGPPWPVP